MFRRLEAFFIASVLVLITGIVLIMYTMEREQEFRSYNSNIQKVLVESAVYAIDLQLKNKRRHVELFLDEYNELISRLDRFPDDERTLTSINQRLQQRFADFFTFTITNSEGVPVLMDIESLVGDACQKDLQNFSGKVKRHDKAMHNEVFLHPQPFHYHYDIMAPLQTRGNSARIFFASFYLDEIANILKTHEIPGQQLLLVRQSDPNLIEVSRQGARDKLNRNEQLTPEEQLRILVFENVPESDWRLVNLPDADFEEEYVSGLWKEVIIMLIILALGLFFMIRIMFRYCENIRQ